MMKKKTVFVCIVVGLLGLLSAATGFAAEATRIKISDVKITNSLDALTSCLYPKSPAFQLGLTAAAALLIAHIIINVQTGCLCCRRSSRPSGSGGTTALFSSIISWLTFVVAFILLLAGAVLNHHDGDNNMSFGRLGSSYYCFVVKPGVFAGGAMASIATVGLGILSFLSLTSAKKTNMETYTSVGGGGIAMTQPQFPA